MPDHFFAQRRDVDRDYPGTVFHRTGVALDTNGKLFSESNLRRDSDAGPRKARAKGKRLRRPRVFQDCSATRTGARLEEGWS